MQSKWQISGNLGEIAREMKSGKWFEQSAIKCNICAIHLRGVFFNCLVFSFSLAIFYWFLISAIKCNICAIHLRGVVFVFKASIAAAFERCSRCRMKILQNVFSKCQLVFLQITKHIFQMSNDIFTNYKIYFLF